MRCLRLGPWLLVPWYERVAEGRQVEVDAPADAARLVRRLLESASPISLRAFVRELDVGAPLDFYDGELIERLALMIARRRVHVFELVELPMISDEVVVREYTPEPAPFENIIDDGELVDWSVELEADEPVWFEITSELEELPAFSAELASELEELPAFEAALSTGP
jgi:hypothetical protein